MTVLLGIAHPHAAGLATAVDPDGHLDAAVAVSAAAGLPPAGELAVVHLSCSVRCPPTRGLVGESGSLMGIAPVAGRALSTKQSRGVHRS